MATKLARMAEVLSRSPSTRNIGTTAELSQNVAAGVTKTAVPGEDGVVAKAADQDGQDEEEDESGAAEDGRRRV